MYAPVGITSGTSSFDVAPADHLDPSLFDGERLRSEVRMFLLGTVRAFLSDRYMGVERWLRVWLAGSGVSYRWHATSGIRDLDVLLGIDWVAFRQANPSYVRLGDAETARHINDELRSGLWPSTSRWLEQYEVTWYVNPKSWDIQVINPYAAYDLVADGWTVPPSAAAPEVNPEWLLQAEAYRMRAQTAVERYSDALTELRGASSPVARRNAEGRFRMAVDQAVSIFESVHAGRRNAFSPTGGGYDDPSNFLWQSGKKAGWIPALKKIRDYQQEAIASHQRETYGLELPDTDTLIRRAALRYS